MPKVNVKLHINRLEDSNYTGLKIEWPHNKDRNFTKAMGFFKSFDINSEIQADEVKKSTLTGMHINYQDDIQYPEEKYNNRIEIFQDEKNIIYKFGNIHNSTINFHSSIGFESKALSFAELQHYRDNDVLIKDFIKNIQSVNQHNILQYKLKFQQAKERNKLSSHLLLHLGVLLKETEQRLGLRNFLTGIIPKIMEFIHAIETKTSLILSCGRRDWRDFNCYISNDETSRMFQSWEGRGFLGRSARLRFDWTNSREKEYVKIVCEQWPKNNLYVSGFDGVVKANCSGSLGEESYFRITFLDVEKGTFTMSSKKWPLASIKIGAGKFGIAYSRHQNKGENDLFIARAYASLFAAKPQARNNTSASKQNKQVQKPVKSR